MTTAPLSDPILSKIGKASAKPARANSSLELVLCTPERDNVPCPQSPSKPTGRPGVNDMQPAKQHKDGAAEKITAIRGMLPPFAIGWEVPYCALMNTRVLIVLANRRLLESRQVYG